MAVKVIVYHSWYNCDSGCCGHRVDLGKKSKYHFDHPDDGEDPRAFAERLVTETYGENHVADLDWENCIISYE